MVWAEDPETGEKSLKLVVQTFMNETDELVNVYAGGQVIETTEEHPFWVVGQGWTEAALLKAGDLLKLENGKTLPVEKIEFEQLNELVKVYNFEVEDFHTYYVGENFILVHNADYRNNKNQRAVFELAKSKFHTGLSVEEAGILDGWARDYGVPQHHGYYAGSGSHWPGGGFSDHTHIGSMHIKVY